MPHPTWMSRRQFLGRTGRAALALPGLPALLAACSKPGSVPAGTTPSARPIARPESPVTLPLRGQPIAADTPIEKGATLRVYNWADYVWKKTMKEFEQKFDCRVDYTSFTSLEEALQKVTSGAIRPDVYFPGPSYIGRLVYLGMLQPLNHDLIPNMTQNVWKTFWDPGPWYDRGWRYSVPYTVLSTGVAYRRDRVSDEQAATQGYDLLGNPAYRGKISYYDSMPDAIGMAILRNGGTDVNSGDPKTIDAARDWILHLLQDLDARLTYNGVYVKMPAGEFTVAQAWSGDTVAAQYYLPKGTGTGVLGYWYPSDRPGLVGNDIISIPTNAQNPRLAHEFINFLLDAKVGFENFAYWTGYMPPFTSIDPDKLVAQGVIPKSLSTSVVTQDMMDQRHQLAELSPAVEDLWTSAWDQIKAGA
jgi:spermidine/putrescine transport system substrate-binding protein